MGVIKKVTNRIVDVRVDKWMSWGYLTDTADRFKFLLMDIVVPQKATYSETFEEAMQRLELTEQDIERRKVEFHRLFYFFLALAVVIIGYALYLAFAGSMVASLISFCLALYALTQAFRFHFWLFQLKHRKLGCTIREWMNAKIIDVPKNELATTKSKEKAK